MPGDEDKKKKKKSKKAEEAPPPEPEPEPAPPAQEESSFFGDDDGADDWMSGAPEDTSGGETQAAAGDEGQMEFPPEGEGFFAEGEGDFVAEGEEGAELPPQPKQKPKYFVHWDRRKAKFYDYNYDYGTNYYSSMVGYCDTKNAAFGYPGHPEVPRRMAFAERGMLSSLERHRNPDNRTQNLLNDIRSNIRNFENSQRLYAYGKKI